MSGSLSNANNVGNKIQGIADTVDANEYHKEEYFAEEIQESAENALGIMMKGNRENDNEIPNAQGHGDAAIIQDYKDVIVYGSKPHKRPNFALGKNIVIENLNLPGKNRGLVKQDMLEKLITWLQNFDMHPDIAFEIVAVEYEGKPRITAPAIHRSMKNCEVPIHREEAYQILSQFDRNKRGFWAKDDWMYCWQCILGGLDTAKMIARHSPHPEKYTLTPTQTYTLNKLAKLFDCDKKKISQVFETICTFCQCKKLAVEDLYHYLDKKIGTRSVDRVELRLVLSIFDDDRSGLSKTQFMRMMSPILRLHQRVY